ncbi:39S ribosomal protein L4, mitochondrial [Manis javanica]|nr:39S ribosomal protein L4, mitochondrial [Manis javanica]
MMSSRGPGCRSLNALAEEAVQPAEKPEPVMSALPQAPVLRRCELPVSPHRHPVQSWIESLRGYEQERVGLAELHPEVFSTAPRLDILHQAFPEQPSCTGHCASRQDSCPYQVHHLVGVVKSYAKTKTRAEHPLPDLVRRRRCPWPPGPHELLHAAHESAGAGAQGGADCQAGPGQPAHRGLPGAADRRPPVPDRTGPLPPLGELHAPRGPST